MLVVARIHHHLKSEASAPCVGSTLTFFLQLSLWTERRCLAFLLKNESPLLGQHKYTFLKYKATKENPLQRTSLSDEAPQLLHFLNFISGCACKWQKDFDHFGSALHLLLSWWKNRMPHRKKRAFQNISVCHVKYTTELDSGFINMEHGRISA